MNPKRETMGTDVGPHCLVCGNQIWVYEVSQVGKGTIVDAKCVTCNRKVLISSRWTRLSTVEEVRKHQTAVGAS